MKIAAYDCTCHNFYLNPFSLKGYRRDLNCAGLVTCYCPHSNVFIFEIDMGLRKRDSVR
jgi:hypothetical protein